MIRFLYADQLDAFPVLRDGMFRDRATQFRGRLGWEVTVDADGFERDEYDDINPLYVIWETAEGRHGGSLRLLPTTGDTMVNDHFLEATGGVRIESPLIWESTRFCLAPGAPAQISAALMQAAAELMDCFHIDHFVAVFDARMIRVYRMIGASPDVIGTLGQGRQAIGVGLWEKTPQIMDELRRRSGVSAAQMTAWFDRAFGPVAVKADLALIA